MAILPSVLMAEPQPTPAEAQSQDRDRLNTESGTQPGARGAKGGRAARRTRMPLGVFLQGPHQPRSDDVPRQTAADSTHNKVCLINTDHWMPACLLSQAVDCAMKLSAFPTCDST